MPMMQKTKKAAQAAPTVNHELRKLLALAKKYRYDGSKFLELGAVTAKIRDHGISVREVAKLFDTSYRRLYYAIDCDDAVKRRRVTKTVAHELGVTSQGACQRHQRCGLAGQICRLNDGGAGR
jgi:hypothetical protein